MNNGWQTVDSLSPRFFHNLVLLPTGQVMAVGGVVSRLTSAVSPAVKTPQIWTPSTGQWTSPALLDSQYAVRNYHSTAVLLPDGRVLSSSGESHADKYTAEIFCPPYLFKPNSSVLAERPVINRTATTVAWRQPFTICVPTEDSLTRAVLIRPGATTHSFDENQRYVPLTRVTKADNPPRLLVTAPASPDSLDRLALEIRRKDPPTIRLPCVFAHGAASRIMLAP